MSRPSPGFPGPGAVWMRRQLFPGVGGPQPRSSLCPQLSQSDMLRVEPSLLQYPDWRGHLL